MFVYFSRHSTFSRGFLIVHAFYHSSELLPFEFTVVWCVYRSSCLSLTCLWQLLSSSVLSSGVKYSSISFRVSFVSFVSELSGFRSVVMCVLVFFFPAASLYTAFQGLASVVKLQYSFHVLVLSLFIVAAYFNFWSKYVVFSLCSALSLVLWYFLFKAFVVFRIAVISCVPQGTDLCFCVLCCFE